MIFSSPRPSNRGNVYSSYSLSYNSLNSFVFYQSLVQFLYTTQVFHHNWTDAQFDGELVLLGTSVIVKARLSQFKNNNVKDFAVAENQKKLLWLCENWKIAIIAWSF